MQSIHSASAINLISCKNFVKNECTCFKFIVWEGAAVHSGQNWVLDMVQVQWIHPASLHSKKKTWNVPSERGK